MLRGRRHLHSVMSPKAQPSLIAGPGKPTQPSEGVLPFGDGGFDNETQRPRVYTHGPCSSEASYLVIDCAHWSSLPPQGHERREFANSALHKVRENGFVILEKLLPEKMVAELEAQFADHYKQGKLPSGFIAAPLRAQRVEIVPPFAGPWASKSLLTNELVLEVVTSYLCNHLADGRSEEEQKDMWIRWVCEGSDIDWFASSKSAVRSGSASAADPDPSPCLYHVTVVEAPPNSPSQRRHRDIILPGPRAQLIAQVALTPLSAVNGPVAFVVGSHVMRTPGYEVVAIPPRGSVVLYDSFMEHRAVENLTPRPRRALYITFQMHGIFTGYARDHFGVKAAEHTEAFRGFVELALRDVAARAPGSTGAA